MKYRLKSPFPLFLIIACLLIVSSTLSYSTEMVYTPVNPSFGGNPNNAPGLMSIAQAQNGFTATQLTPIQSFNLSLQRAILSRLTSEALFTMFGTNNMLEDNTYNTVGYIINVLNNPLDGTVTVTTTDKNTGAVASFIVGTSGP